MKFALLCLVAVATVILCVECRSPVRCTRECDKSKCPPKGDCKCGSYLGACSCCEFCLKCPGESCSFVEMEYCVDPYECRHTEKLNAVDRLNKPGTCIEFKDIPFDKLRA